MPVILAFGACLLFQRLVHACNSSVWCMPVILAFERSRQEDQKLKVNLDCTSSLRLARKDYIKSCLKKKLTNRAGKMTQQATVHVTKIDDLSLIPHQTQVPHHGKKESNPTSCPLIAPPLL